MHLKWTVLGVGVLLVASIVLLLVWVLNHSPGSRGLGHAEDTPPGRVIESPPPTETAGAGRSPAQLPAPVTAELAPRPGGEQPAGRAPLVSPEARPDRSKVWTPEELEERVLAETDPVRLHELVRQRIHGLEFEEGPLRWFIEKAEEDGSWPPEKIREKRGRLEQLQASLERMRAELQRLDGVQ